ncbi:hypothetical protein Hypma_012528 [Hypsizygus marmoreus]|uniref:DUF6534 domain-containing protein n=1 Tax=Hypsizygus marmoreus TaxID=39966 RepID=A0A369JE34_HYPMA|nr:hypothetical protein Hypma_012528 [Hypsizygus marmoreus]
MATVHVQATYGAILLGSFFATLFSGIIITQVIVYFNTFPDDSRRVRALVVFLWCLDILHMSLIWATMWNYFIAHFGDLDYIDIIPWSFSLTILFTGITTITVQWFFIHRIFLLSKRNWFLTIPLLCLSIARLVSAIVTTAEMFVLRSLAEFKRTVGFLFTLGLAILSGTDILITISLVFLLYRSRTGTPSSINHVINSLILYTFETATLTCVGAIASMICWLTMETNLVFLGVYFVISKFYAISILVTLNARQSHRRERSSSLSHRPLQLDTRRTSSSGPSSLSPISQAPRSPLKQFPRQVEITVERSVEHGSPRDSLSAPRV